MDVLERIVLYCIVKAAGGSIREDNDGNVSYFVPSTSNIYPHQTFKQVQYRVRKQPNINKYDVRKYIKGKFIRTLDKSISKLDAHATANQYAKFGDDHEYGTS